MSALITSQAAFDQLADRMWAAQPKPPVTGRRRGRVNLARLARHTIAPVTHPKHRKQDTP